MFPGGCVKNFPRFFLAKGSYEVKKEMYCNAEASKYEESETRQDLVKERKGVFKIQC